MRPQRSWFVLAIMTSLIFLTAGVERIFADGETKRELEPGVATMPATDVSDPRLRSLTAFSLPKAFTGPHQTNPLAIDELPKDDDIRDDNKEEKDDEEREDDNRGDEEREDDNKDEEDKDDEEDDDDDDDTE